MAQYLSILQQTLEEGRFAITAEVRPPKGSDKSLLIERIRMVKDYCHAINITDNVRGIPLMSSVVCAHYAIVEGCEPVLQLTTRDRNRIMLQSDLFGAYALGVRNLLFIRGDPVDLGTYPDAKMVYDLSSIEAVSLANELEHGFDMAGDDLEGVPSFFVGSTYDPNDQSKEQMQRLQRKIEAGAQFFQTQAVFDVSKLEHFMKGISGLDIKTLVGVIPLRNPEIAEFMDVNMPGISIPHKMIARLHNAGEGLSEEDRNAAFEEEGIQIAIELIEDIKRVPGVSGIHLMGVGWIESVPEIVRRTNLHHSIT